MIYHITKEEWKQESPDIEWIDASNEGVLERILDYLLSCKHITYDSETTGFDKHTDKLFCYQLGTNKHQFVIDHRVLPITRFKKVLEEVILVGVNLKFDLGFLYKNEIYPKEVIDCMLNEVVLTSGLYNPAYIKANKPYSFQTLAKKYCDDDEVDKTIGASFSVKDYEEPLYEKEIIYSAKDVKHPITIWENQLEDILEQGVSEIIELENNFVLALASIEFNGLHLDRSTWSKIRLDIDNQLTSALEELNQKLVESIIADKSIKVSGKNQSLVYSYETIGGDFKKLPSVKWSSADQVKQVFNLLGINLDSVGKDKLTKLKAKYPFIGSYLDYKALDSLKVKFSDTLEEFINSETGNIHPDFWQIVSTGRLSCNRPNLQQIPSKGEFGKRMRHSFVAEEGDVLVTSDISGAEIRLVTQMSKEPAWIKALNDGSDLHSVTACNTFGITLDEVLNPFPLKPEMTYRYISKTLNFGLIYSMSEYKLSDTLAIPIEDAKDIIDRYFEAVPVLRKYLERSKKFARENLVAYSMLGRPRYFSEPEGTKQEIKKTLASYERMGCNMPIQASNADWIKLALTNIYKEIRKGYPAKIRLTVHDEIVCSVPENLGQEWKEKQEQIMIDAGKRFIDCVPIIVESNIGKYWSH